MASLRVALPCSTGDDLGAEDLHPGDVEGLALGVDPAHVDAALQAHEGGRGGRGDAVLAGAGLGDDPGLAHPLGEQRLGEDVVDLVRAGVVEVLALEDDARPTGVGGEARHLGDDARPAGVRAVQPVELVEELGVDHGLLAGLVELLERRDQRLGDVAAAERPEPPRAGQLLGDEVAGRASSGSVRVGTCGSVTGCPSGSGARRRRPSRRRRRGGRRCARAPRRRARHPHPARRRPRRRPGRRCRTRRR